MSHPTPWQLELHALGESVPAVAAHLPCAQCQRELGELTEDPGPVPLLIAEALAPKSPWSGTPWAWVAAGVASTVPLAVGVTVWVLSTPTPPPTTNPPDPIAMAPQSSPAKTTGARETAPVEPPSRTSTTVGSASIPTRVAFDGEGHVHAPAWSLDGRHLAFEVNDYADRSDLHIATVGSARANKVHLPGGGGPFGGSQIVMNATWHPSGIVVFEGSSAGRSFRLYYSQPERGAASEMVSASEVAGDLTFPAHSPSGAELIFVSGRSGNGDLTLRTTDSGAIRTVLATPEPEAFPTLSQDGTTVAYARKTDDWNIWTLDLEQNTEKRFAGGPGDQTRPRFAGETLVYFSSRGERWDLVAGGSASRVLARDIRLPLRSPPAISPNGEWIAYTVDDPRESDSVFLVRTDGSEIARIETPFTAVGEPAIGKGQQLAFTALPASGDDSRALYMVEIDREDATLD